MIKQVDVLTKLLDDRIKNEQLRKEFFEESRSRLRKCVDTSTCWGTPDSCADDETSFWPYKNIEGVRQMQVMGLYLYWKCPTILHLVESLICSVTDGREIEHHVKPIPGAGGTEAEAKRLTQAVNRIVYANPWQHIVDEFLRSTYMTGEAIPRLQLRAGDVPRVMFIDPTSIVAPQKLVAPQARDDMSDEARDRLTRIGKLKEDELRQLVKFGVLHATHVEKIADGDFASITDYTDPLYFYFKSFPNGIQKKALTLEVDARTACFRKYGTLSQMPRGVNPWVRVHSNSLGIKELIAAARDFALRLAEYAIVEKVDGKVATENVLAYATDQQYEADRNMEDTGEEFIRAAKKITSNVETISQSLAMGSDDMIKLIESEKITIGSQIGAPDVVSLGRSNMGARNTSSISMSPWYAKVRKEQGTTAWCLSNLLWRGLFMIEEATPDMQGKYKINATGWTDPEEDAEKRFERVAAAVAERSRPLRDLALASGAEEFKPDQVCTDLQAVSCLSDPLKDVEDNED